LSTGDTPATRLQKKETYDGIGRGIAVGARDWGGTAQKRRSSEADPREDAKESIGKQERRPGP